MTKKLTQNTATIDLRYGCDFNALNEEQFYVFKAKLPVELRAILNFFMVGDAPELIVQTNRYNTDGSRYNFTRYKIRSLLNVELGGHYNDNAKFFFYELFCNKEQTEYEVKLPSKQKCQELFDSTQLFVRRCFEIISDMSIDYHITYEVEL